MAHRVLQLDSAGIIAIEGFVSQSQSNMNITRTLIEQLRQLGAAAALIEDDYIDRDFSEAYSAYYAKTFRRHTKLCTRILFFATDISFLATVDDVRQAAKQLESQDFLGFIVLRPILHAPICQVVLRAPPVAPPFEGHILVKGRYAVHVLGAELHIEGIPMTQQDSRIGACAQATIWTAARHFHTRRKGPWLSTVAITQAAITNPEGAINQALPVGSEFLSLNNMVAAFRSAGQEALVYAASTIDPSTGRPVWLNHTRPEDIINRYVDSGIPVILGLKFTTQAIGHAVIITGQVLRETPANIPTSRPTRSVYCEAYYGNDDQIGPNIIIPVDNNSTIGGAQYNIKENAVYLIIPLPSKVYLPAEKAEALSWDILGQYANDWSGIKTANAGKLGGSEHLGDGFLASKARNEVLARTYLTFGWKYKNRNISNNFTNPVRKIVRNLELPRFVYVTEFSTIDSISSKAKYERRIFAHAVIDATAKHHDIASVLLFHAPGFMTWHEHEAGNNFVRKIAILPDSEAYYPKIRGDMNFDSFHPPIP